MSERYIGGIVYNPPAGWSAQFNGSNRLSFATNQTPLLLSSSDFTFEAWVYRSSGTATVAVLSGQSDLNTVGGSSYVFYISSSSTSDLYIGGSGYGISSPNPSVGAWAHVAWVRTGGTYSSYLNGARVATRSDLSTGAVNNGSTTYAPAIGAFSNGGSPLTGYISNARLIKGSGGYNATQSTITVPTGALLPITNTSLLTCRYPTIVDGSTNALTITNTGTVSVATLNPFPTSQLPNPALGGAGNGVYTMSQYAALKAANLWPAFDPFYRNVTLNLHGNGTNAAQNNTFLDSSTNNFTITRNGNTTQGTFSPYGSNWSNYFDGSGDYLSTSSSISLSSSLTVECWFNLTSAQTSFKMFAGESLSGGSGKYVTLTSTGIEAQFGASGATISSITYTFAVGTWYHFALVRNGTTVSIYINGVAQSVTNSTQSGTMVLQYVGVGYSSSYVFTGFISNFRINTTAVYTANFTPSVTPLTAISGTSLLICQSNRFVDNSASPFTITVNGDTSVQRFSPFSPTTAYSTSVIGGSGYFDGTGDTLTTATGVGALGSSDFSIEAWVYVPTTLTDYVTLFNNQSDLSTAAGSSYTMNVGPGNYFGFYSGTTFYGVTSPSVIGGAWNHVAFVRTGANLSCYLNGARVNTRSDLGTVSVNTGSTTYVPTFGGLQNGARMFTGYVSSFRRIIGSGGYDATSTTITVPTAPLTATANTNLLLNFTNAGILDNAMMNNLETMDGVQISTSVKKYGTGSISFDGNNDALYGENSQTIAFPADFTIESWVYLNTLTASYQNYMLALTTGAVYIDFNSTYIDIGRRNVGADLTVTYTLPSTQWFHLAFCRSGSTMRIFVNGAQVGSGTVTTNYAASAFYISYPNSAGINGYVDDFRITKGVARYTTNFTPPTSQVQDQ